MDKFHHSHDESEDVSIPTTDEGYYVVDIENYPSMQQVSEHVLLNQAGVCTDQLNQKQIQGTNTQNQFNNIFACTRNGEASPLLQLEAYLLPCILYSKATSDPVAGLGGLTIFKWCKEQYSGGISSLSDHTCARLTCVSSSSSTNQALLIF